VVEEDVRVLHVVDPHGLIFISTPGDVGEVEVLDGGGNGHTGSISVIAVLRVGRVVDGKVGATELQVQGLVGLEGLVVQATIGGLIELEGQDHGAGGAGVGEVVVLHDDVEFPGLQVHHVVLIGEGGVGVDDVHERDVLEGTIDWGVLRIKVMSGGTREIDDPFVVVACALIDLPLVRNVNGLIDGNNFGLVCGLKSVHEGDVVVDGRVGGVPKLDLGLLRPLVELAPDGDVSRREFDRGGRSER